MTHYKNLNNYEELVQLVKTMFRLYESMGNRAQTNTELVKTFVRMKDLINDKYPRLNDNESL